MVSSLWRESKRKWWREKDHLLRVKTYPSNEATPAGGACGKKLFFRFHLIFWEKKVGSCSDMEHLIKLRTIFLSEVPQILKSFTVSFLLLIIYKIIWSFEEERIAWWKRRRKANRCGDWHGNHCVLFDHLILKQNAWKMLSFQTSLIFRNVTN